jgi:hypothetical protein
MKTAVTISVAVAIVLGLGVGIAAFRSPKDLYDPANEPQQTPIPRTQDTPALSDQQRIDIDARVAEIKAQTLRKVEKEVTPSSIGDDIMAAYYDGALLAKITRQHRDTKKTQWLDIYYDKGKVVYVRVGERETVSFGGDTGTRLSDSGHYFVDDGRMATYWEVEGGVVRWEWDDQTIQEIESRVHEDDALAKTLFATPSAA